jgi:hypothetical protein
MYTPKVVIEGCYWPSGTVSGRTEANSKGQEQKVTVSVLLFDPQVKSFLKMYETGRIFYRARPA